MGGERGEEEGEGKGEEGGVNNINIHIHIPFYKKKLISNNNLGIHCIYKKSM